MLKITILGIMKSQRYVVQRMVAAALYTAHQERPGIEAEITVIKDMDEMQRYTPVLVGPALRINGQMVCVGRIPSRSEIEGWIQAALEAGREQATRP